MRVTSEMIKNLREATGAGIMDCKRALEACEGDPNRARALLYERSLNKAVEKSKRAARQGLVHGYMHMDKVGAMIELNCETDFAARTPEFSALAHDLAMQVVACRPEYVSVDEVPSTVIKSREAEYREQCEGSGKPAAVIDKIVEGRVAKFLSEACLLEQPFIKDPARRVRDVINEQIARSGENVVLRRFMRMELTEE